MNVLSPDLTPASPISPSPLINLFPNAVFIQLASSEESIPENIEDSNKTVQETEQDVEESDNDNPQGNSYIVWVIVAVVVTAILFVSFNSFKK